MSGTSLNSLKGRVVTEGGALDAGVLTFARGKIRTVGREPPATRSTRSIGRVHDFGGSYLLPGFVEPQINGSFGIDVATEPERLPELSAKLPLTGVTSYLPTVISSPKTAYPEMLGSLASGFPGFSGSPGAEPLGVHLEGPFLNSDRRGAHERANVIPPDPRLLGELLRAAPVRLLTLAPELEGAEELTRLSRRRGTTVSAGHSDASFEAAWQAFGSGVSGVTHLFNAMSPLHHREPGLPGAALGSGQVVCGVIADGRHVHPEAVRLAYRLLGPDRVYLTTDAVSAAGAEPGSYTLAGQPLGLPTDPGDVPRLATGETAGSALTMDGAFRNAISFTGCTVAEAAKLASTTAADLIGVGDRKGRLLPGYDADVVALSPDLELEAVWKAGERLV